VPRAPWPSSPWRGARVLATTATLLAACGPREAPKDATEGAQPVPDLAVVARDSGAFTEGRERVTWRRDVGSVAQLVLEETVRIDPDADATRRYVFSPALDLLRYTERRSTTRPGTGGAVEVHRTEIDVEYEDQVVVRHMAFVDGESVELSVEEMERPQRRALRLLGLCCPTRAPKTPRP